MSFKVPTHCSGDGKIVSGPLPLQCVDTFREKNDSEHINIDEERESDS